MQIRVHHSGQDYTVDLDQPIDISIPLISGAEGPNCFWAPPFETSPLKAGDFIGSLEAGAPVNFYNIKLNPHGNGTHTECVGHIKKGNYSINDSLKRFHFITQLITVLPQKIENDDRIVNKSQVIPYLSKDINALIIRTQPNHPDKLNKVYSGTNPCYLDHQLVKELVERGINHLIVDLPSIDKEEDGGELLAHHAFWIEGEKIHDDRTITEMVFVPDSIKDGNYFLNIQITSMILDASPSKLLLYELIKIETC